MLQESYSKLQLTTPQAIHSTVLCDERTCLWFEKLFSLSKAVDRVRSSAEGKKIFKSYSQCSFAASALLALAFGCYLAFFFFFNDLLMPLGLATAAAAGGSVYCMVRTRHYLAELARHIFSLDQNMFPAGMTLYQLGEIYARQYGVPSLVALISIWDQWARNAFLLLFASAFGVFFLPFWKLILWLLAGYFLATCLIKAWLMLRQKI
jgi:hypothetical protein